MTTSPQSGTEPTGTAGIAIADAASSSQPRQRAAQWGPLWK